MASVHIGQKLFTTTHETAIIEHTANDVLIIKYKDKYYRRPVSIVGNKLFTSSDCSCDMKNNNTCNDCMVQRRGDCIGQMHICSFFRFAPTMTQSDRDNWPKYGDATCLRMTYGKR